MSLSAGGTGPGTGTGSFDNTVSIQIGPNKIIGWESVSITRGVERCPNSFAFTMTEPFPADPNSIIACPGLKCTILIGNTIVLTGYVDRYQSRIKPTAHEVEIVGRGLCEDLVDCSADLISADSPVKGGSISASSALDLAQKLCKPFAITAMSYASSLGKAIQPIQVAVGETPYEVIERVARYAGFLVYEETTGYLILDTVGTNKMASGFVQGVNIEDASVEYSVDGRYSSITITYGTVDGMSEGAGVDPWFKRAQATDPTMTTLGRVRPKLSPSLQTSDDPDFAQKMANWEMARRIGRSQALRVTCDSWRDGAGALWKPNWLVPLNIPALKLVNKQWLIGDVTFRKDASGTHADLTIMPPIAFSVEPSPLNLWDNELHPNKSPPPAPTNPPIDAPTYAPRPEGGANT